MPSIWDFPRREEQRGSAMGEPRARMLQVLGLLGTPFPTSDELGTSALYRAGKLDAMAGGPTKSEFREGVREKMANIAFGLINSINPKRLEQGLAGEPGYVYHATNDERLRDILASGKLKTHKPGDFTDQDMWPDGTVEKRAYFGKSPENLWQFAPEEGTPVVLRTKHNPETFKRESTGDIFTRKPVNAKDIEFLGDDGKWHALKELTPSGTGSVEMSTGNALGDVPLSDLDAQIDAMRAANRAKGLPPETGTGDLRNERARRKAVELLGLPEGNTAADRAAAMGFDTDTFRGSPSTNRPEPDVTLGWSSTSPDVANTYTGRHRLRGAQWDEPASSFSPYVMPLKVATDKTIDATGSQFHSIPYQGYFVGADQIANLEWPASVKISNVLDVGGGRKDILADSVTAYPRRTRSRFAAFDPSRRDEADLLAGLLPYAIPAGLFGLLTLPREEYQ